MTTLDIILVSILAAGPVALRLLGSHPKAALVLSRLLLPAAQIAKDVVEAPAPDRIKVLVADLEKAVSMDEVAAIVVRLKSMLSPASKASAPLLPILALAFALIGCTGTTALQGALDASNVASHLEQMAAPLLVQHCVAPMQGLAEEDPMTPGHEMRMKALEDVCDAKIAAYDAERKAHLILIAAIVKAESQGSFRVADLFSFASDLDNAIGALATELSK